VTDANLLLGYLDADFFAGGTMRLDTAAAGQAMASMASEAGLSAVQAAWGVHDLVNETMAGAARMHIAERGEDPRKYALLTTGGGGPLHGCAVARKLGLATLLCPPSAGVASALGLLVAPARVDRVATVAQVLQGADWAALGARFAGLQAEAAAVIAGTGLDPTGATPVWQAELRYVGQGFEVLVSLPQGPFGPGTEVEVLRRFEAEYARLYGRTPPAREAEIVNICVSITATLGGGDLVGPTLQGGEEAVRKGSRRAWFGQAFLDTPVFDRLRLGAGQVIAGPALVEEPETTLLLPPGSTAKVQENGNILVRLG
jgi:N-methylhydantoinase A